jgi:hypothetical protein
MSAFEPLYLYSRRCVHRSDRKHQDINAILDIKFSDQRGSWQALVMDIQTGELAMWSVLDTIVLPWDGDQKPVHRLPEDTKRT